jgi:WD40 repeat protein
MNHTYLRYECADSFGVVVSTGSSRVPHSHSHLGRTTTTTTTANAAAHTHSLLWAVTGSSVTAYCERTGLPTLRLAHREQLSGGVGTGRALNASECACLDVLNVETEADNEPQRRKSPSSTAIRVATGWIDGAVRVFDVTKSDLALSSSSSSSSTTNGLGLAHSLLFDDDGDDDDEERSRRLSDQNREFVKREPLTLNGHSSPVRALRFEKTAASSSTTTSSSSLSTSAATNKNRLASGATDGSVVVWDVVEEVGLFRLVGHKGGMAGGNGGGGGGITDLAFVSTSALVDGLITASVDGLVKVWDLTLQCCVQTLVNHPGPVHGMDCRNLGSSSRRRRRRAWKERINDGDGSSDEDDKERWRLVTGSVDGFVRIWSVQSPGPNRRGPHPSPKASLHGAEFIPAANNELNIVTADAGDMTDNYEKDACCVYLGTVSPPPNAASAHYHQRVECVRWYQNRYLGVLRWDSKHVDIYRVKSPDEAAKTRQRRLRRRREKHNKKRQEADGGGSGADDRSGVASTMGSNKKRGLLDDPDSSDDDGKHNANLATSEDWVDPERVRASDELEYLTTVIASHKVRSFVFVRKRTSSPRSLLRVVCALATNSMETYEVVRSRKEYVSCRGCSSFSSL